MKRKLGMIGLVLFFGAFVQAKYASVRNEKQFFDEINKFDYALVGFLDFPEGKSGEDKDTKKDIFQVKKTIKALAETDPFKKELKEEVGFVVADTSKDALQPVLEKYKLKVDATPRFILFKNGKPLTDMAGSMTDMQGFLAKADLLAFINDYFGKEFDDILAKKSDEMAQEREMQLARLQASASSRYPYGFYSPYNPWGSPSPYMYTGYAAFYPYGYSYNGYAYFIP